MGSVGAGLSRGWGWGLDRHTRVCVFDTNTIVSCMLAVYDHRVVSDMGMFFIMVQLLGCGCPAVMFSMPEVCARTCALAAARLAAMMDLGLDPSLPDVVCLCLELFELSECPE